jgi:hypothetical protein
MQIQKAKLLLMGSTPTVFRWRPDCLKSVRRGFQNLLEGEALAAIGATRHKC